MSLANPVHWFEIPAADIERAMAFYNTALGAGVERHDMGPNKMAWFAADKGAAGATGAIVQGDGYAPSAEGALVYLSVPSIDATLEKIAAAGGEALTPKIGIGEHGWVAQFRDSEGNRVALHEPAKQG